MATVRIEAASVEDWERVRALRLAALAETPDAFDATLEEERDQPPAFWRRRLTRPDSVTLVATVTEPDGGIRDAGLLVIGPREGRPETVGLYSVWVAPWGRGQGVGLALLEAAIAHAAGQGRRRAELDVGDHNAGAIRLYERAGFEPTGATRTLPPPREHVTEHERAREIT